jgi:hypothetical protein
MGILDSVSGLISGRGKTVRPIELAPGEVELAREVASWRPGGASVGGDLVLTNMRLIFTPLETRDAAGILEWGLSKAGAPDLVSKIPGALDSLVKPEAIAGVAAVEPGSGPSWRKPPTLVVSDAAGNRVEIGILAARLKLNPSAENAVARDRMVAAITRAAA